MTDKWIFSFIYWIIYNVLFAELIEQYGKI